MAPKVTLVCTQCKSNFEQSASYYKYKKNNMQTKYFCCRKCSDDYKRNERWVEKKKAMRRE